MNKQELITAVASQTALQKGEATKVVDAVFEIIGNKLATGDIVNIAGFAKFEIKNTKARTGRNPHTGEEIQLAAGKKVSVKPLKALKEKITH